MSSLLKRLIQSLQVLAQAILRLPLRLSRKLAHWFILRRETQGGFVLPTVVMVILVVTLITSAIVIRSTDRAQNASNVRVSQVVLNAALPAVERAKLKLNTAFEDPTLPQGTPSDLALNDVLDKDKYQLGDEVRLQLVVDLDDNDTIDTDNPQLSQRETSTLAWRYPVDTNGNGEFDSFTLYGIYFRSPRVDPDTGGYERQRSPLDARTPPQASGSRGEVCEGALGTSAGLVSTDGWDKIEGVLKKSIYIYTATVPITDRNQTGLITDPDKDANYENYQGNTAFAGLEYQQDRVRIPLGNNAIVYEDDLDMFSGPPLYINGRIVVNSNLHAGEKDGLYFLQVSSPYSCFYEAENAKLIIGGNITNNFVGSTDLGTDRVDVDLFQGREINPKTTYITPNSVGPESRATISTRSNSSQVAYNTQAFEERIALLVEAAMTENTFGVSGSYPTYEVSGNDPQEVRDRITDRINAEVNPDTDVDQARREELEVWFRNRTRRVPFAEIGFADDGTEGLNSNQVLTAQKTDFLRPIDNWHKPDTVNATLNIEQDQPPATEPEELKENDPPTLEELMGDRALAGNNLPSFWYKPSLNDFAGNLGKDPLGVPWDGDPPNDTRYRQSRVRQLVELGLTERDGFWETSAATVPENRLGNEGGLRIVTNAGVYLPFDNSTNPTNRSNVVWPDSMPVPVGTLPPSGVMTNADWADWLKEDTTNNGIPNAIIDRDGNGNPDVLDDTNGQPRPFLKMRASAVYHYNHEEGQRPIACVSSYYDPTNYETAQNAGGLPSVSGQLAWNQEVIGTLPSGTGRSNNGITYSASGLSGYNNELNYMANLVYPNGRLVNPQLKKALATPASDRTLADQGAIDSTICALKIWDGTAGTPTKTPTGGYNLPHGTIQEVAFLDGREVKEIEGNNINVSVGGGTLTWSNRGNTQNNNSTASNRNNYSFQPESNGRTGASGSTNEKISEYDLSVELRQPLEIRATVIDVDALRRADADDGIRDTEWMLPDSGIIYATRDDALADASDKSARSSATIPLTDIAATPFNESDPIVNLAVHELERDRLSPTDFWLDPTRRPSAIVLINGSRVGRGGINEFEDEEKGLILATNLPTYIKAQPPSEDIAGGFNVHDYEEFTTSLGSGWKKQDFYSRTNLDTNFACRPGDKRLGDKCNDGDNWRAVSVLSDTLTLLSENFRFGFRNEGDYDLRNNQTDNLFRSIRSIGTGSFPNTNIPVEAHAPLSTPPLETISKRRVDNGFWDNTFVTNGLSSGNTTGAFGTTTNYTDLSYSNRTNPQALFSSYFNNFVTPIQRRVEAPEYVMEICRKLPISECLPSDWVVGYDADGDNNLQDTFTEPGVDLNGNGTTSDTLVEANITSEQLLNLGTVNRTQVGAGTTALPPRDAKDQHYPRRVAFKRQNGNLVLDNNSPPRPIPLGIHTGGNVDEFPYSTFPTGTNSGNAIQQRNNSLWFRTTDNTNPSNPTTNAEDFELDHPLFYFDPQDSRNPALYGYYDERDDWLLPDVPHDTGNTQLDNAADALNNDSVINYTVCLGGPDGGASPQNAITFTSIGTVCNSALVNGAVNELPNVGTSTNKLLDATAPTIPIQLGQADGAITPTQIGNLEVYNYRITSTSTNHVVGDPTNSPVETQNFIHIGTQTAGSPITITLTGDSNSLFIFHPSANNPLLFQNVNLVLDGVNPNQVFWVSRQGMVFAGENNLAGNFLSFGGPNNQLIIDDIGQIADDAGYAGGDYTPTNTVIRSGRFLGFSNTGGTFGGTEFNPFNTALGSGNIAITGITTTRQPLLSPVLQIARAHDTRRPFPFSGSGPRPSTDAVNETYWLTQAVDTRNQPKRGTFNLIMATGDSPSRFRANNPSLFEFNGAVSNLPRFLEQWNQTGSDANAYPVTIQGSFIQLQRSSYATAPFWQIEPGNAGNNLTGSFLGYSQRYALTAAGYNDSYYPPQRQFGFDVGLLSQLPDLFSQRFTLPPTSEPNEYYREVGRNDDWIQTLLCGVQVNNQEDAVNEEYRPDQCDTEDL
ncbi:hormogonium polysaccharide biosynthesis protein HpsA [Spirulina sp. CS-785/01]|uniref:hormogonium polysaccharide biosynthesis protein HpsA n=1 Tax=Spirulina sp. CS-785/01 TaxID=3021716 RepID=UPI00232B3128|nr:hormogonium polysaccharide biosynthesis protein HpsA [Spirulina sp. CS-785/01]MDB9313683.1 hormogonium polysaccharide biosynthesis protein HpsA [Spirulina sp. CS-785/01]